MREMGSRGELSRIPGETTIIVKTTPPYNQVSWSEPQGQNFTFPILQQDQTRVAWRLGSESG